LSNPQAVALDLSLSPAAIYVADTANNRVLGWRNASNFENGAAADIVLGQRDRFATTPLGPNTTLTSGLSQPTGLAVDRDGNLYVVDTANNRILRFPKPFAQPAGELVLPDQVIGQASLATRAANSGGLSDKSVAVFSAAAGSFRSGLVFDRDGNLFFTDAGNHRVVRYPASSLGPGAANFPAADLVLGQPNLTTNTPLLLTVQNRVSKSRLNQPSSLAIDQAGRLFVADALSRVLVFAPPFTNGMDAARIMGFVNPPVAGQPTPPPITEQTLGLIAPAPGGTGLRFFPPEGVFTIDNTPFVIDSPAHRILRYDPFDQWPPESSSFSPPAKAVIGQDTFQQPLPRINRGRPEPYDNTFFTPVAAAVGGGEVFVVDSFNHRVLVFPDLSSGPPLSQGAPYLARRVLGQVGFEFNSVNFIEGREFFFRSALLTAAGIAVDRRSSPPRLYVADPNNHRVLGFADVRKLRPGDRADVVVGQVDLFRAIPNSPPSETLARTDGGLFFPIGVAVDDQGNLWVADQANSRVLRIPNPFAQQERPLKADLVLGQSSFSARVTDPTSRTLSSPYGLALTVDGHLLVSDTAHHRVVIFEKPFTTGMAASRAFGQPDLITALPGTTTSRMNNPRHIAVDTDDRLYVSDSGNNRVLIFSRVIGAPPDPAAAFVLGRTTTLNQPQGVTVSPLTGEIWVADAGNNRTLRYPKFNDLLIRGDGFDANIPGSGPLAVALDGFGNLLIGDSLNRVGLHFPRMTALNAANFQQRLAPGMYATIGAPGPDFTDTAIVFDQLPNPIPMPTEISDLQVTVNEVPSPIHYVSPRQINFIVPSATPVNALAEVQVVRASTGQVLSSGSIRMETASPGLFATNGRGTAQLVALNQDNSLNSTTNALPRGQVVQLFGTGPGVIPGAPPDGTPATGIVETPNLPRVFVNVQLAPVECPVQYSGVAPGLIGVWQINVVIPTFAPANNASALSVIINDAASPPAGMPALRTTIAIR